jgi:hypothetical protein
LVEFELQESNAWGLILNGSVEANTQWEVLYASQSTSVDITGAIPDESAFDLDVEYLHVGGTYLFDGDRVRPFIAATLSCRDRSAAAGKSASEKPLPCALKHGVMPRLSITTVAFFAKALMQGAAAC